MKHTGKASIKSQIQVFTYIFFYFTYNIVKWIEEWLNLIGWISVERIYKCSVLRRRRNGRETTVGRTTQSCYGQI